MAQIVMAFTAQDKDGDFGEDFASIRSLMIMGEYESLPQCTQCV